MLETVSILDCQVRPALAMFIDVFIGGRFDPPPISKVGRLSSIQIRDSINLTSSYG